MRHSISCLTPRLNSLFSWLLRMKIPSNWHTRWAYRDVSATENDAALIWKKALGVSLSARRWHRSSCGGKTKLISNWRTTWFHFPLQAIDVTNNEHMKRLANSSDLRQDLQAIHQFKSFSSQICFPIQWNSEMQLMVNGRRFLRDFRTLSKKAWLLTVRKPGQTIMEIFLAYMFIGFLLGMRYILDRRYVLPLQIPAFRPQDYLTIDASNNVIYYYPSSFAPCSLFSTHSSFF